MAKNIKTNTPNITVSEADGILSIGGNVNDYLPKGVTEEVFGVVDTARESFIASALNSVSDHVKKFGTQDWSSSSVSLGGNVNFAVASSGGHVTAAVTTTYGSTVKEALESFDAQESVLTEELKAA